MVEWQAGNFMAGADAWRFWHGHVELRVAGTLDAPSPHWLAVAKDVLSSLDRYQAASVAYLDRFVDRSRFGANAVWELELIEVGLADELAGIRFILSFRMVDGDDYGLWSLALHASGLESPHEVCPLRLQRLQQ